MDLVKWILLTEIITEKMLIIFASSSTRKQKESYLQAIEVISTQSDRLIQIFMIMIIA
jgi:hypothetical protein